MEIIAIIVNELPYSCRECPLESFGADDLSVGYCSPLDAVSDKSYEVRTPPRGTRPKWCPLVLKKNG